MPSIAKVILFFSSAKATAISVGLLGFCMSTTWFHASMDCAAGASNATFENGSATITVGLFDLISERKSCPSIGRDPEFFKVFAELGEIGPAPQILHVLCVLLLVLCLVSSCGSILISLYNSVSNPYETYMGPVGVYVCSSVSACLSFAVLVLFALNVFVNHMPEELVKSLSTLGPLKVRDPQIEMGLGYYLVIPYLALSLLAIGLIYLYQHAAYTHRREQQRPTQDAPKEIMMY
ncbi:unnamed protein product [Lota lota]